MLLKNKNHYGNPFRLGASSRSIRAWSTRDSIFLLSVLAYIVSFIIMYKWKNFGMGIAAFIPVITAAWVYGAAAGCAAGLLSLAANIGICQIMGINPLAAIASGALLMAVEAEDAPAICSALAKEQIPCNQIGEVLETNPHPQVWQMIANQPALVSYPARDEIASLFEI